MRANGYNVAAIAAAAVVIYLVGFIIYGMLVTPALWMESQGITQEQLDAVGVSRMIYSPLMPLATAVGLAILFRWTGVSGGARGAQVAGLVALLSALPAIWYGWVYGVGGTTGPLIDSAHLLLGHVGAGAVLGRWQ